MFYREKYICKKATLWWVGVIFGYVFYWGFSPIFNRTALSMGFDLSMPMSNAGDWVVSAIVFGVPTIALVILLRKLEKYGT